MKAVDNLVALTSSRPSLCTPQNASRPAAEALRSSERCPAIRAHTSSTTRHTSLDVLVPAAAGSGIDADVPASTAAPARTPGLLCAARLVCPARLTAGTIMPQLIIALRLHLIHTSVPTCLLAFDGTFPQPCKPTNSSSSSKSLRHS
ncbi:uncharacterized protein B0I36DRAFT_88438 [Microdochium trichocladiopsis]|uniref:Uncharacterized protein n=1 Tax=Microdochium trichocladiopsis TaxID=1682393 RepID=A0A9P8YBR1_9PEZI|nr:uncharacterized protein B0I36DRAFT_88438 [Microdochium trichocladiopsis]KAH7035124.1 hypothetical protein B0I36DRAFT_88438 [Microdochium trichocladiopsis]